MARGRMLNKSVSASVKINNLSDDTCRLLATWIIPHLDVRGVFYGDPAMVKSTIFPRRADITVEQVAGYLQELCDAGLVEIFQANGDTWQHWPGFAHNQVGLRVERESSDFPLPPGYTEPESQPDDGNLPDNGRNDDGELPAEEKVNLSLTSSESKENIAHEKSDATPKNQPPPPAKPPTIAKIMAGKHTKLEWLAILESEKASEAPRATLVARIEGKIRAQEPAVVAYKQITGKSPPTAWCDDLVATVQDCERWRNVVKAYIGQGWNPSNVANMLEFYRNNDVPGNGGGKQKARAGPRNDEPAGFQGIREWLAEEVEAQ